MLRPEPQHPQAGQENAKSQRIQHRMKALQAASICQLLFISCLAFSAGLQVSISPLVLRHVCSFQTKADDEYLAEARQETRDTRQSHQESLYFSPHYSHLNSRLKSCDLAPPHSILSMILTNSPVQLGCQPWLNQWER